MKKTFITSKNKDELIEELKELKINYNKYKYNKEMLFVRVESVNKLLISSGRDWVCWKLNFDVPGEITVKKGISYLEYILLGVFIVVDAFLFFFFLHMDSSILSVLGAVGILGGVEFLVYYPMYIFFPMMTVKKFVNKYLLGNK